MDRRKFLKFAGIGVASAVAGKAISAPVAEALVPPKSDVGFVRMPDKFRYIESPPYIPYNPSTKPLVLGVTPTVEKLQVQGLDIRYPAPGPKKKYG